MSGHEPDRFRASVAVPGSGLLSNYDDTRHFTGSQQEPGSLRDATGDGWIWLHNIFIIVVYYMFPEAPVSLKAGSVRHQSSAGPGTRTTIGQDC